MNDVSSAFVRSAIPALLGTYLRLGCGPLCVEKDEPREAQARAEAAAAERDMVAILRKCVAESRLPRDSVADSRCSASQHAQP